ncbi:response regulator transcription factor [Pseudorhodobacter sp. W20_MBD10_FR17]|uniref:response regulator transcription factor n=1 Tax=Pseudorhodobacter sp. W20_MBD10_FR17 TaxID=3240266 RepID=UPI003F9462F3
MSEISVLIVEDDPDVRKGLRLGLEAQGWQVYEAWNRTTMLEALRGNRISIITLDLNLGKDDGLKIALEMRQQWNTPVVMISGRHEPYDRVRGLECGADDYIVKPFHIREVVLRLQKTLESYQNPVDAPTKIVFDHSELDLKRMVAQDRDGTPLDLTSMELQLLELFVRNPGRVLSRDEISNALYGRDWSHLDRSIDGHVARLRRKIGQPDELSPLIRSVRGVGYVFSGDVVAIPEET